jgi:ribosome-associated protein
MAKTTGEGSKTSSNAPRKRSAARATSSKGTSARTQKTKRTAGSVIKGAAKKVAAKSSGKRPAKKVAETPVEQNLIRQNALQAAQFALEKKAVNVRLLDLTQITSMTDYFIVCTGESEPQVKAIAENVISKMRDDIGVAPWRSEGWDAVNWILIDFVDFVVHVFQPESRQYYNLERLWADAPTITVEDTVTPPKPRARKKATLEPTPDREETSEENPSGVRVISDFNPVAPKSKRRLRNTEETDEE